MDAIFGFLNNPLVLSTLTIGFGLLVTYHPKARNVPNALITYLNAVLAFMIKLTSPTPAAAAELHVLAFPLAAVGTGVLGLVTSSLWQALQSYLVFKGFLHDPLEQGLGWRKPEPVRP